MTNTLLYCIFYPSWSVTTWICNNYQFWIGVAAAAVVVVVHAFVLPLIVSIIFFL